jgi:hypothetical protein
MATRTVFTDEDNNEMDCYINDKGKVYIGIGQGNDDPMNSGYITLDKEDVNALIKVLQECEENMKAE